MKPSERDIIKKIIEIDKDLKKRKTSALSAYNLAYFEKQDENASGVHTKQIRFHKCQKKSRWVFGGNRSGKTECGAVECVWLLRGIHPFRENKAVNGWAVSVSREVSRDVAQEKILKYLDKS